MQGTWLGAGPAADGEGGQVCVGEDACAVVATDYEGAVDGGEGAGAGPERPGA